MSEISDLLRGRVARDTASVPVAPSVSTLRGRASRRRARRVVLTSSLVVGVVAVAAVAGSTFLPSNEELSPAEGSAAEGFDLPSTDDGGDLEAIATGVLSFTVSDCPYLVTEQGTKTALNVFARAAHGMRDESGRRYIVGADGVTWGVEGDIVQLGGGPPAPGESGFVNCGVDAPTQFVATNVG